MSAFHPSNSYEDHLTEPLRSNPRARLFTRKEKPSMFLLFLHARQKSWLVHITNSKICAQVKLKMTRTVSSQGVLNLTGWIQTLSCSISYRLIEGCTRPDLTLQLVLSAGSSFCDPLQRCWMELGWGNHRWAEGSSGHQEACPYFPHRKQHQTRSSGSYFHTGAPLPRVARAKQRFNQ